MATNKKRVTRKPVVKAPEIPYVTAELSNGTFVDVEAQLTEEGYYAPRMCLSVNGHAQMAIPFMQDMKMNVMLPLNTFARTRDKHVLVQASHIVSFNTNKV